MSKLNRRVWRSNATFPPLVNLHVYEDLSDKVLIRFWSISGDIIYAFGTFSSTRGWCIVNYSTPDRFEWMEIPE